MQKEVVQGCITSFVGGIWNWEGVEDYGKLDAAI